MMEPKGGTEGARRVPGAKYYEAFSGAQQVQAFNAFPAFEPEVLYSVSLSKF